jgi:ABC-2 type transport system permease protein
MLSLWSIYIIIPLVMMGGVFHPMSMLPDIVRHISKFNPMYYLVDGMRYSVTGVSDSSILVCALISLVLALGTFFATVYMFRIGYKLRT